MHHNGKFRKLKYTEYDSINPPTLYKNQIAKKEFTNHLNSNNLRKLKNLIGSKRNIILKRTKKLVYFKL